MTFVQRHWVKVLTMLSGVVAASFVAETGQAGQKINSPVVISAANRSISGSLGSVRNSGDNVQFLQITATDGLVNVVAAAASGNQASCASTNEVLVNIALHLPSDANVLVQWDASGACSALWSTNTSFAPAKSQ